MLNQKTTLISTGVIAIALLIGLFIGGAAAHTGEDTSDQMMNMHNGDMDMEEHHTEMEEHMEECMHMINQMDDREMSETNHEEHR